MQRAGENEKVSIYTLNFNQGQSFPENFLWVGVLLIEAGHPFVNHISHQERIVTNISLQVPP